MPRILIAEDMPDIAEILRMGLTHRGFEVIVAIDGEAALAAALGRDIDLAILDVHMPKMNGTQVLQRIRAAALPRHLPVIMLTADPSKDERARGVQAGADGYCIKPFRMADIIHLIESLLPRPATGTAIPTP